MYVRVCVHVAGDLTHEGGAQQNPANDLGNHARLVYKPQQQPEKLAACGSVGGV